MSRLGAAQLQLPLYHWKLQRLLRQALDAEHERVAQALRRRPPTVEAGRQQLLGVQRVALAALEHALDQIRAGSATCAMS